MDIRTLRYFEAVATTESFRKAAELMHVGQSTLSKQIIQMEADLGCEVFIRAKQRVHLSPAGKLFLEDARRIIREFDFAVRRVQQAASGERGILRIGCRDSMSRCELVSRSIMRFHAIYPQVELYLEPMMTIAQCEALLNGQIDLGIVYTPPSQYMQLSRLPIVREHVFLALPSSHHLADADEIDIASMSNETFINLRNSRHNFFGTTLVESLHKIGFSPANVQNVDHDSALINLVSMGLGVSIWLSQSQDLAPTGTVLKPIKNYAKSIDLELIWLTSSTSQLVHNFIGTMRNVITPAS